MARSSWNKGTRVLLDAGDATPIPEQTPVKTEPLTKENMQPVSQISNDIPSIVRAVLKEIYGEQGASSVAQGQGGFQDPDEPVSTTGTWGDEVPMPKDSYVIKSGDTLTKIAANNPFTFDQLIAANPQIEDPNRIEVGQQLNFPPVGKTITSVSQTEGETVAKIKEEDSFVNALFNRLVGLEGLIREAKIATKGEKFYTIGYGHYGSDVKKGQKITKEQAEALLLKDINKRLPAIRKAIPSFDSFSNQLKVELAQSWFRGGLSGSPETIKLINKGDFQKASLEFLNNDEYKNAVSRGRKGIRERMEAVANTLKLEGTA